MFSNHKNPDRMDASQREQYDYARRRIMQKKRLMQHFIVFIAVSVILILINGVLGIGTDFFIKNWFVWVILLWSVLLLIHFLNVFILSKFMGKEWEDRQLEQLKLKQEKRLKELEKKITETNDAEVKKTIPFNDKKFNDYNNCSRRQKQ